MNSANLNKKAELIKWLLTVEDEFYYRIQKDEIQIITFFSNRKNPEKRKF